MYSIRELFKIGNGPSSSHTIGPKEATLEFKRRYPDCDYIDIYLYGSLALTGKGHLTDYIIEKTILPIRSTIHFDILTEKPHPNTIEFVGYKNNEKIAFMRVFSIGGGAIKIDGDIERIKDEIYPLNKYKDISEYCNKNNLSLSQYIDSIEDESFNSYMDDIYNVMLDSIDRGLNTTGVLPGKLEIKRKANYLYYQNYNDENEYERLRRYVVSYAYAVSEENASGGLIVTAPTCGASGVLPAVLKYSIDLNKYSHKEIIDALKVAGLIGNLVKKNGSISGAEAGCQAEVGTACSMASAYLCYLENKKADKVSSAAEIALEHHLGLTCDPIDGYVQIPCIERNAVAALRSIDAAKLAGYLNNADSKISFDLVVETMLDTGKDLLYQYRETSQGGLAKNYK